MKKIITTGLSLFLGLALLVTATMARVPAFGQGFGGGQEFLYPALPILGEKQFYKVEALQEDFLKEIKAFQHDLLTKRTELGILRLSPNSDSGAKKAKEKEIRNLQAKVHEEAINFRFEIWKILNQEQRAQFDAFGPVIGLGGGGGNKSSS
jgi:Spy/CpxP family protein refolding chaperone